MLNAYLILYLIDKYLIPQEVIKYFGIYSSTTPTIQWSRDEFMDILYKDKNPNKTSKLTRYENQITIFGELTIKKSESLNTFLIESGAVGFTLLKNFAMMDICITLNLFLTSTEHDRI